MEREKDAARFMPTICHNAGIPLPKAPGDSLQAGTQTCAWTILNIKTDALKMKYSNECPLTDSKHSLIYIHALLLLK